MPKQEQIEILNAQLLSFLRVDVDVPNHGDCLFDTLVHVWNVEVLRDAMVDDMQAQLQKRTEEAATITTDEAAKYRKQGVWGSEVCMLPLMRVLRANIKVVTARPVSLDLYYEYRDANAKPSEYTLVLAKEMGAHHFRPGH